MQDSAFVISWNSLLGAAANKGFGRRWLFTVIRKNDLTDETLDALWEVFGWSMNVLLGDSARTALERQRGTRWRALCG